MARLHQSFKVGKLNLVRGSVRVVGVSVGLLLLVVVMVVLVVLVLFVVGWWVTVAMSHCEEMAGKPNFGVLLAVLAVVVS